MAASKQKKDDPFVVTFEERGDQTIVRKSNDLVQMTRNNLTLSQQRLMLHIFSMIKPEDTDLPSYELSIYDFIKMTLSSRRFHRRADKQEYSSGG